MTERMRALIEQAAAEARSQGNERVAHLHLRLYGPVDQGAVAALFDAQSRGTPAEGARLTFSHAADRYICWNCCGLRFEGASGVCPNCGGQALPIPDEIAFALVSVEPA
jgi:Zn finger protein HypA/HybF involved in hydrogenase expression